MKTKEKKTRAAIVKPVNWQRTRIKIRSTTPYVQKPRKREAPYTSDEGWNGVPAPGLRLALIDASKSLGWKRSSAKLSVFVEADGFDTTDGMPLVRIKGKSKAGETGTVWEDWSAGVTIRYDSDLFKLVEILDLLRSAGAEIGIGYYRPGILARKRVIKEKDEIHQKHGSFCVLL